MFGAKKPSLIESRRATIYLAIMVHIFACTMAPAQEPRFDLSDRTVSIVVPFPAGGRTDLGARIIAEAMARVIGSPVQVLNRVGAGGTIAARQVLTSSKPDALVILITSAALLISSHTIENAPRLEDFVPIAVVSESAPILFTRQASAWRSVKDLVADARKHPEAFLIGGVAGSTSQVLAAGFMEAAEIKLTMVPFKGDADAVVALGGGHIDLYISGLPAAKSMLDADKLRPLAIVGDKQVPGLPGVPLIKEAGIDFVGSLFDAVLVPKSTAEPLLNQLELVLQRVMHDPMVTAKASGIGLDFVFIDRSGAAAFLKAQDALYQATIKRLHLKP
jgi:tripartite-type tricarboxylate transporter receptor subunit TctC